MIFPVTMYSAKCDNCGKEWIDEVNCFCAFTDENSMAENVNNDDDWHNEGDKHYCKDCFTFDDEDNLIVKTQTT
jgi:hypothetical protein